MGITIAPAVAGRSVKHKTADENVNNSTTLQDDDHLFFTIAANEVWVVEFHLFVSAISAAADLKVALAVPAGSTSAMGIIGPALATTGTEADAHIQSFTNATTALSVGVPADSAANGVCRYSAYVAAAGTSGTVQLQWAQNTATASNTTVRTGSFMVAERIS